MKLIDCLCKREGGKEQSAPSFCAEEVLSLDCLLGPKLLLLSQPLTSAFPNRRLRRHSSIRAAAVKLDSSSKSSVQLMEQPSESRYGSIFLLDLASLDKLLLPLLSVTGMGRRRYELLLALSSRFVQCSSCRSVDYCHYCRVIIECKSRRVEKRAMQEEIEMRRE